MKTVFVVDGTAISERVAAYAAEFSGAEIETQISQSPMGVARKLGAAIDDIGVLESRDLLSSNAVAGVHVKGAFDPGSLSAGTPAGFLPIPLEPATISARLALLAMAGGVGAQPVSYRSENKGELFVNLSPMRGEGRAAEKSVAAMRGHTDAVSFPFPKGAIDPVNPRIAPSPDYVCLACLRNPGTTETRLMPLDDILEDLDTETISELCKGQFTIGCQYTFRKGTKAELGRPHMILDASVLRETEGGLIVRYSHSNTDADEGNSAGRNAIAEFEKAVAQCAEGVTLSPGDILVVNNRKALHGRSEVGGGGDTEQPRWLLRGYALHPENFSTSSFHGGSAFMLFP